MLPNFDDRSLAKTDDEQSYEQKQKVEDQSCKTFKLKVKESWNDTADWSNVLTLFPDNL